MAGRRDGHGLIISDDAYPIADALAEVGWLRREPRTDGEMAWFWTAEAEVARASGALVADAADRQN
jgi:hypothetical protein